MRQIHVTGLTLPLELALGRLQGIRMLCIEENTHPIRIPKPLTYAAEHKAKRPNIGPIGLRSPNPYPKPHSNPPTSQPLTPNRNTLNPANRQNGSTLGPWVCMLRILILHGLRKQPDQGFRVC